MLDIRYIREHAELVKDNTRARGMDVPIDRLLDLDVSRREVIRNIEALRAKRNQGSKGKPTQEEITQMKHIGEQIKTSEKELTVIDAEYTALLLRVPNLTAPSSPVGTEDDFVVVEERGDMPRFSFEPKDHETLLTAAGMLDFERGAKVVGSKFYYAQGDLVRLNQALLNYGMSIGAEHGYQLVETPDLAKDAVLLGAGFNPRGDEQQIYNIEGNDLSLIGTAEIPMLGYHQDEILDFSDGPKRYMALSHCFRMEGGAYGRTSKGLYRVHQFTKLEMFIFCPPDQSDCLLDELVGIERTINDELGLRYRVIDIPTGDLGAPAYKKYDLEAYMVMVGDGSSPGYGEITSASNCTDYQARRMNIRYKSAGGKHEFVHTLNGTAIALSRTPVAIVEQYQQADGSIRVPDVLQQFIGKESLG